MRRAYKERPIAAYDIETYPNYFLLVFMRESDQHTVSFELRKNDATISDADREKLIRILKKYTIVGYNSNFFDLPLVLAYMEGFSVKGLWQIANHMIKNNEGGWLMQKRLQLDAPKFIDHIDIMLVVNALRISLKLAGARIHFPTLSDLPIEPNTVLSEEEKDQIREYCKHDTKVTLALFDEVRDDIELRKSMSLEYGWDLRSKSDAQIAEAVFKARFGLKYEERPLPESVRASIPDFINFKTPTLQKILRQIKNTAFKVQQSNGNPVLPKSLGDLVIKIGNTEYSLGIGGLHSKESSQAVIPTQGERLIDADVTSYYPSIILRSGLYPEQIGPRFLDEYRHIVERRVAIKHTDPRTAGSLKIVINGTFGKLGNKWSVFYAPHLLLSVTLTGQLSLLMLIERLEMNGLKVVSANTDGLVTLIPEGKQELYDKITKAWERHTQFQLEYTEYSALHSRDVNSYITMKPDGSVKRKGYYAPSSLRKNPELEVVSDALVAYLRDGIDPLDYVKSVKSIKPFLMVRTVRGGAVWKGQYLGRVARWVWTREGGESIHYKKNGNKVPKSDGALQLMDIGNDDASCYNLDYQRYADEVWKHLELVGVKNGNN